MSWPQVVLALALAGGWLCAVGGALGLLALHHPERPERMRAAMTVLDVGLATTGGAFVVWLMVGA